MRNMTFSFDHKMELTITEATETQTLAASFLPLVHRRYGRHDLYSELQTTCTTRLNITLVIVDITLNLVSA